MPTLATAGLRPLVSGGFPESGIVPTAPVHPVGVRPWRREHVDALDGLDRRARGVLDYLYALYTVGHKYVNICSDVRGRDVSKTPE